MSKPVITGFPQSSYVWTARAALNHKGVEHEFKPIGPADSKTAEHLAAHPWGKVPTLEHDKVTLYETTAILTYAEGTFEGPSLRAKSALDNARIDQVISICNAYLYPAAVVDYALQYIFPRGPEGAPDREAIEGALPNMKQAISVLDGLLGDNKFFVGESGTSADLFVAPLVAVCTMFPEGKELIGNTKGLGRHLGTMMGVEAFRAAAPPQG